MSGVLGPCIPRALASGVWRLVVCVWGLAFGVRCQASGDRRLATNVWCLACGVWHQTLGPLSLHVLAIVVCAHAVRVALSPRIVAVVIAADVGPYNRRNNNGDNAVNASAYVTVLLHNLVTLLRQTTMAATLQTQTCVHEVRRISVENPSKQQWRQCRTHKHL